MLRVSSYNIYVPLNNEDNEYIFIQGYLGSIDIVSRDIYELIESGINDSNKLKEISEENLSVLKERGYITDKSFDEEKEIFKSIAEAVHKVCKNYVYITLMPTYNCNFRCSYCYERNLLKNGSEWLEKAMDKDTVDRVFQWMDNLKADGKILKGHITLYGGEPLLKENYQIVKYILEKNCEYGYKMKAISNGYDLDIYKDELGVLIQSVQITLDGVEDYHNQKRFLKGKKPTFSKIIENIELCLSKGVEVIVRTNIDNENILEIGKLINFYKQKGWTENKKFSFYFKNLHACYIDKNSYIEEDIILDVLKRNGLSDDVYEYNNAASSLSNTFMMLLKNKKFALIRSGFCGATNSMYVVDPFGDLYPCWEVVGEDDCCIGNLKDENFEENEIYRYWRNRTVQNIPQCSICEYAMFCGGGCPAHIRARKGDIYLPYCSEYKKIFHEVIPKVYKAYIKGQNSNQ